MLYKHSYDDYYFRWCSMFNADLALSVTMTAISTILSIITLPLNLLLYTKFCYNRNVVANVDWSSVFVALNIVISAVALGLFASYSNRSHKFNMIVNKVRLDDRYMAAAGAPTTGIVTHEPNFDMIAWKSLWFGIDYIFSHSNQHGRCRNEDLESTLEFLCGCSNSLRPRFTHRHCLGIVPSTTSTGTNVSDCCVSWYCFSRKERDKEKK